jgi:hypothetical protein
MLFLTLLFVHTQSHKWLGAALLDAAQEPVSKLCPYISLTSNLNLRICEHMRETQAVAASPVHLGDLLPPSACAKEDKDKKDNEDSEKEGEQGATFDLIVGSDLIYCECGPIAIYW